MSVNDRLFETLDPTTRGFDESRDGRYLVTDTVGFIRRLPHQLVEAFAATLEETLVADLVLHVADASVGDEELEEMLAAVDSVLARSARTSCPIELVMNKVDALDALRRRRLANRFPAALAGVGARPVRGSTSCGSAIAERFGERFEAVRLLMPYDKGARLPAVRARRADRRARRSRPRGSSCARGCRAGRCAASRRS